MAKLFVLLLFPFILRAQSTPDFAVRFDQTAFVQLTYRNNPRPRSVSLSTFNVLPTYDNPERIDTLTTGQGRHLFTIPVRSPQPAYWQVDKLHYDLYLLPTDTIKIEIDFRQDTTWKDSYLTFIGPNAPYQEFYRQLNLTLPGIGTKRGMAAGNTPDLNAYQQTMDSLRQAEEAFFLTYTRKHPLPQWFVNDIALSLLYQDAAYRENTISYRRFMNKGAVEPIPDTYFSYRQKAVLSNRQAIHSIAYWLYVSDYLISASGRPVGLPSDSTWMRRDFIRAQQILSPQLAEFYKAVTLSANATSEPAEALVGIQKWAPTFSNRQLIDVITADAKARIKILKPGDMAPNFALPDLRDSLLSLNSFRGNVVLLCFWFPGCKPCLAEFPYENKLVEIFRGKPVRIVSVCTNSNPQMWQKAVQQHSLKTKNLFANASWQKTLESKYAIAGYPHYVLIDQQGRIVRNFASRPSTQATTEIEQLIK